jgi:hypothetical protein
MAAARMFTGHGDLGAMLGQQMGHGGDIRQMWQIAQNQGFIAQQTGRQERQGGVLGTADGDLSPQGPSSTYAYLIHLNSGQVLVNSWRHRRWPQWPRRNSL